MRVFALSCTLIINFILQSTLFEYIQFGGIKPNTAIVIVIAYAILRGDVEGSMVGFFAGFLQDIFFAKYLGYHALFMALTGFFFGKPFRDFYKESYLLPLLMILAGVLCYELIFYFFHFMLQGQVQFTHYFLRIILPATVYTALTGILIYRIMYGINRRLEVRERKRLSFF